MKKALKIFLAVILIITALISLSAAIFSLIALGSEIYNAITKITYFSYSFFLILSAVINIASACLAIMLFLLFVVISIGCVVSTVYIFIGSNDTRIAKLKAVIDEAYRMDEEAKDDIDASEQTDAPTDAKEEDYE